MNRQKFTIMQRNIDMNILFNQKSSLLIVLLFAIPCFHVWGQEHIYKNMLEDCKEWHYNYHHFDDDGSETVTTLCYKLQGDTIIGDKTYNKMLLQLDNSSQYYGAYREENQNVYYILADHDNENIAVDFSYDGLYNPNNESNADMLNDVKDSIDMVIINGVTFRRHHYVLDKAVLAIGVEGIGYRDDGIRYPDPFRPQWDCLCDYEVFTSCIKDGQIIFKAEDFIVKGLQTSVEGIKERPTENGIFDLNGHRLMHKPRKGLYIQKRKKMAAF